MTTETKQKKQQLGQFFTTNSDYIFQGLGKYVKNKIVSDPFAGAGDLLDWAEKHGAKKIKGYDVDVDCVDNKKIFLNDSLLESKTYEFVITNPPYLNINKADALTKEKFFKSTGLEDLYQISLRAIMDSEEGIVIVPVNFLSAQNSEKIRKEFFDKFHIIEMNYFKEPVFADTTYNVIAFYYEEKPEGIKDFSIKTNVYPDKKAVNVKIEERFGWLIGGDFVSEIEDQENFLNIRRLTEEDMRQGKGNIELECAYNHVNTKKKWKVNEDLFKAINSNIILLKAIDSGTESGKIALEDIREHDVDCLVSKSTSRHMIYLTFGAKVSVKDQKKLIELFNEQIEFMRDKYLSLFLTNYRDKDRKRIGFDFAYKFLNYLYSKHINNATLL